MFCARFHLPDNSIEHGLCISVTDRSRVFIPLILIAVENPKAAIILPPRRARLNRSCEPEHQSIALKMQEIAVIYKKYFESGHIWHQNGVEDVW
jgi:hypothetical protein